MGVNRKCPKCGSAKVQLSTERNKHGNSLDAFVWNILYLLVDA